MAVYRYILADLLTNQVNLELPFYGVSFGRKLNAASNMTCSFALDSSGYDNKDVIEATEPGRTALYIDRDGQLIWGGIIWSRTWQEQSKSISYTGQSFESYPNLVDVRNTLQYVNTDQRNIVIDLFRRMQDRNSRNLRILLPSNFPNNVIRSVNFYDYEAWTYGKAIKYMVEYDQGLDYTIDVRYGATGALEKVLRVDDTLGSALDQTQLVFDYPGGIKNFWYPENASKAATTMYGIGAGEGSAMPRIIITNQKMIDAGYPDLVQFYTNKDISNADTLVSKTAGEALRLTIPITVPTFEVYPDTDPQFGQYNLGDYARFDIESARFPEGKTIFSRIIGWEMRPTASDSQEEIKLIVAGEETQ